MAAVPLQPENAQPTLSAEAAAQAQRILDRVARRLLAAAASQQHKSAGERCDEAA